MKLHELLETDLLRDHIDAGDVRVQLHPEEPLRIFNYTAQCQFEKHWTDVTRKTRGLIVDDENNVIARPFPKFFNYGEHEEGSLDLTEPAVVLDKLDGSLGILYPRERGGFGVATRGSFTSDQAFRANKIWNAKYAHKFFPDPRYTYLFEIIYPENRIVVHYPDIEDLVMLAVINTASGAIYSRDPEWRGPRAEPAPAANLGEALALPPRENAEGLVIRFVKTGKMLKIKQDDYVELHRLVTGLSEKVVWERIGAGETIQDITDKLPDEFYGWVEDVVIDLETRADTILDDAEDEFKAIQTLLSKTFHLTHRDYRKHFAEYATKSRHPSLLFLLLDEKDIAPVVWQMVKPQGVSKTPLRITEDVA